MKAVILAGGLRTRLLGETTIGPKPMVNIGGRPMLWHIMKTYQQHGVSDFVVCLGHKGDIIKQLLCMGITMARCNCRTFKHCREAVQR